MADESLSLNSNGSGGGGSKAMANTSGNHGLNLSPYDTCILPSYFNHFAILILIATTIVTQLSHLTKILLMVVITGENLIMLVSRVCKSMASFASLSFNYAN